jgi:NADPH2:quinone reductase
VSGERIGPVQAIQIENYDGPDAVRVVDIADPDSRPDEVLIEVHVAGVSFPELLQSRGAYQIKPDLPFVPGSEVAGVVRSAPADAKVKPGDRVAAFCIVGGFADLVAVPPEVVFPIPDAVSYLAGAALPMNYLTMHFGLVRRGQLRAGDKVLVHGAAGGIGTASIQLANALGAHVIAVTSSAEKAEIAHSAGADDVIAPENFRDAVAELTGGRGVDIVVDPVGGDRFTDSLRSLAPEGRLLVVGFTGGEIPTVKVNRLLLNNIGVIGVGWGAFWSADPGYLQEQWRDLAPMLESGAVQPITGTVFELTDAASALGSLESRQATGKTLLRVR